MSSRRLSRCIDRLDRPAIHRALLRTASWLVPARQRAEWLAEWHAELWHIAHERQLFAAPSDPADLSDSPAEDALAFCLGAFSDALWLRRNTPRQGPRFHFDSARNCWLALAAVSALVTLIAIVLPGPHNAMQSAAYLNSNSIVQIFPEGVLDSSVPSLPLVNYVSWTHRTQRLFSRFTFYTRTSGAIDDAGHRTNHPLSLAIASDNFFDLLQIPLQQADFSRARLENVPAVVLSQMAWQRDFAADPDVVGRQIRFAGREAIVSAIVADNAWAFPGRTADAWLLEEDAALANLAPGTVGYIFAAVNPKAAALDPEVSSTRWHMEVPVHPGVQSMFLSAYCDNGPSWYLPCRTAGESVGFDCISLADTIQRPSSIFLFMLVLAVLALPATIPLSFGDEPVISESLFASTRWRRWGFLLAKLGVIVPLVYFGSLDLAYGRSLSAANAEYIQLAVTFVGCLALFRWALYDQRQRCPVCLRLLTNPVRVGEPSRNFLAWSGTEMICSRGHGLLHTAELSTSWVGPRRWLHLDPSWKPLFTDAFTTIPS